MTRPTNTDLADALREIANTLPLGSALVLRLAADRLGLGEEPDGWVTWWGGEFPKGLTLDTRVDVKFRDGGIDIRGETVAHWKDTSDDGNNWFYSGSNDPAEIIAYRLHS